MMRKTTFFALSVGLLVVACTAAPPQPPPPGGGGAAPPPESGQPGPEAGQPDPDVLPPAPEPTVPHDPFEGLNFRNGWARIPFNFSVFGGYGSDQMNDVVAGGPGFVAGGFSIRDGELNAGIWFSENGAEWFREEDSPDLGGPGSQIIHSLARGEAGFAAVGTESIGDDTAAAAWFSGDGLRWQRIAVPGGEFGDQTHQQMRDVTAAGGGFVAVGLETTDTEVRGAVWVSPDGRSWERVPHAEATFGGSSRYVTFSAVIPVGGSLLAAGSDEVAGEDDVDAAIWFSHDGGRTWTLITNSQAALGDPDAVRYQLVEGITQGPEGFFMVATEQNLAQSPSGEFINGLVWNSTDGLNWTRIYDHKPDFAQQTMLDIAYTPFGYVIVGYDRIGDEGQAAVWMSSDGAQWIQVQHSETVFGGTGLQQMRAVAASDNLIVAVGSTAENGELDTAVWIYHPDR